jgi:hypothetical protein
MKPKFVTRYEGLAGSFKRPQGKHGKNKGLLAI